MSDSISASRSNSPRASMIAVPCSPIGPETKQLGRPAAAPRGAAWRAGSSQADPGRVKEIPSASPGPTTLCPRPRSSSGPVAAAAAIPSTWWRRRGREALLQDQRQGDRAPPRAATARSLTVP